MLNAPGKIFFVLNAPGFSYVEMMATKVTGYLTTGVVQILDQHQDLIGTVASNLLEIQGNEENETDKVIFFVKNSTFIVCSIKKQTNVFLSGEEVQCVNAENSIQEISQLLQEKEKELAIAFANLNDKTSNINEFVASPKKDVVILLQAKVQFLKQALLKAKEFSLLKNA